MLMPGRGILGFLIPVNSASSLAALIWSLYAHACSAVVILGKNLLRRRLKASGF
jgi:hypothetical protein